MYITVEYTCKKKKKSQIGKLINVQLATIGFIIYLYWQRPRAERGEFYGLLNGKYCKHNMVNTIFSDLTVYGSNGNTGTKSKKKKNWAHPFFVQNLFSQQKWQRKMMQFVIA